MKNTLPLALAGILCASSAMAATVNIDFGRGPGHASGDGTTSDTGWNNVTSSDHALSGNTAGIANLENSAGDASGYTLDLTYAAAASVAGGGADWGGSYPAAVSSMPASAISDSFFLNDAGLITMTFSNLSASETYDFLFYGARGNNGVQTSFTVTGAGSPTAVSISNVFENSTQAPTVLDVSPNGSGIITVVVDAASGSGAINAMQMTSSPVPEPSSFALLGLAGLGLLRRRRG